MKRIRRGARVQEFRSGRYGWVRTRTGDAATVRYDDGTVARPPVNELRLVEPTYADLFTLSFSPGILGPQRFRRAF